MQKATFKRHYRTAKWLVISGFLVAFFVLSDFIWEGGSDLVATLAITPAMMAVATLVFARCVHCQRLLGWISAHKKFDDQPDPRTLDNCSNCGEPFFAHASKAS